MLAITKIGYLGSGKENMQTYGLEIHTHLKFSHIDVRNIKHGREKVIHECIDYMCANATRLAIQNLTPR